MLVFIHRVPARFNYQRIAFLLITLQRAWLLQ